MESASEAAERAASTAAGLHAVAEYEAEVGPIPVEADERARAALAAAGLPDDETQGPRFGSAPIPVPIWYHPQMAMTLRLTEEQTTDVPAGQAGIVVRHYAEAVGVATILAIGNLVLETAQHVL